MEEKRKASKSRIYWLNKRDIEEIGGLLFPDEEFRPVKGESAIWISNYARVLSKRKLYFRKDIKGLRYRKRLEGKE